MDKKSYLKLVQSRKESIKPIELKMPSKATWLVLPLSVAQYAVTGRLPLHLFASAKPVAEITDGAEQLEQKATGADVVKIFEMVRDVMLNNLVEPKITLEETDDSITPEQIDPEDFDFFMAWVMSGGQAAQDSFRTVGTNGKVESIGSRSKRRRIA